jgi:hypothetical protein
MLLNNRIVDDVLEFPTIQVKSRFVSLILYSFVSETWRYTRRVSACLFDASFIQVT